MSFHVKMYIFMKYKENHKLIVNLWECSFQTCDIENNLNFKKTAIKMEK